jgi:hypothetical protein
MVLCCTEKLCGGTDAAPQGAHPLYRLSTASKQKIYQSEKRKVIGQTTLTLLGLTTDGSALSPTPLAEVLRGVPPQLCSLQVVKDSVKAVLGAVSSARNALAATQAARTKKRLAAQGAAWCKHRHLFVQRHLHQTARQTLGRVSRG